MGRVLAIWMLCVLAAPASAAGTHEWYVLKTDDGVYAYDAGAVTDEAEKNLKSVWILSGSSDGYDKDGFFVSCQTNHGEFIGAISTHNGQEGLLMVEGDAKATDRGWVSIPDKGVMKIAANVACARRIEGAIRVDNEQAAIDKLKTLSN